VLFSDQGKLKPGVLVSTITDKLKTLNDELKFIQSVFGDPATTSPNLSLIKISMDNIKTVNDELKSIMAFFGEAAATSPKLTEIKNSLLELATLQAKYEDQVEKFSSFRKNLIEKFFTTTLDKLDIQLPDITKSIDETKNFMEAIKDDFPRMITIIEKKQKFLMRKPRTWYTQSNTDHLYGLLQTI
jgi:hypothetical protein